MKRNYDDVYVRKPAENPKFLGENTEELMRQVRQRNKCDDPQDNNSLGKGQGEVNTEIETIF